VAKKKGYHHGDLRRALLDAGLKILVKQGPEGITLRELARRAGVTHAAPYRHFADKEALLAAVAEEGFRAMGRKMDERRALAGGDAARTLHELGVGYVLFAVEHPAHFKVMFGREISDFEKYPGLHEEAEATFERLVAAITALQQGGQVRPGDPMPVALTCWSMVHGLATLYTAGRLGELAREPEGIANAASRLLLDGVLARKR